MTADNSGYLYLGQWVTLDASSLETTDNSSYLHLDQLMNLGAPLHGTAIN